LTEDLVGQGFDFGSFIWFVIAGLLVAFWVYITYPLLYGAITGKEAPRVTERRAGQVLENKEGTNISDGITILQPQIQYNQPTLIPDDDDVLTSSSGIEVATTDQREGVNNEEKTTEETKTNKEKQTGEKTVQEVEEKEPENNSEQVVHKIGK
jgi:hypothetical protein